MTSPKQIRGIGIATLVLGLTLAAGSAWAERETRLAPDVVFAQRAEGMASRLFTLAIVFIVIGGYEFQRARTLQRFAELEQELKTLSNRMGSAA